MPSGWKHRPSSLPFSTAARTRPSISGPFELGKEGAGAEREDAAIPGEAAIGEELFRALEIGFFDEARGAERALADRFAALEIAVAGFGRGRRDPEADHPVVAREFGRAHRGFGEGRTVGDVVVARAHQHHRVFG